MLLQQATTRPHGKHERQLVARTFNMLPKVERVQLASTCCQDRISVGKGFQLVARNRQHVARIFNMLKAASTC